MKASQNTVPSDGSSAKQILCGPILCGLAVALNQPSAWINVPLIGAGLGLIHHAAVWLHSLGKDLTWPEIGGGVTTIAGGCFMLKLVRSVRGAVVRRMVRCFVDQQISRGKTYHFALGVNNGGDAVKCFFVDEWNKAIDRRRSGTFHVRGDMIDCTEVEVRDGSLQTYPDMDRVRDLQRKADKYSRNLQPGEKLRVLVICDESRSGDTVNRLLNRLERPDVAIEVLAIIRRAGCKGRIDWFGLESSRRDLLPCSETPKTKRPPCPFRKRRTKGDGDDNLGPAPVPI